MKSDIIKPSKLYYKNTMSKTLNNIKTYTYSTKNKQDEAAKTSGDAVSENDYANYIRYLLTEVFKNKEDNFINKIDQMMLNKLSQKKKIAFYGYIVLISMLVFEIVILIIKFK